MNWANVFSVTVYFRVFSCANTMKLFFNVLLNDCFFMYTCKCTHLKNVKENKKPPQMY